MSLKSYPKENKNINKLHKEIAASNTVAGFTGLFADETHFSILGTSILNEPALDLVVSSHTPIEVPEEITPQQGRKILFINGFTDTMILDLFNAMPSPDKELAIIEWEYAISFIRSNPLIAQMGAALGLTAAQIDQMFIDGSQL